MEISIIVPVYNTERYISKCLKSILEQTFTDFEVLVINDGSTDNSQDIIEKFTLYDKRIKTFRKKNGGLSSARNYGIEKASGKFICFIDSDDWVKKNFLNELYYQIISEKNADVVIGKYQIVDSITQKTYIPYENESFNKTFVGKEKINNIVLPHIGPAEKGKKDWTNVTTMCVWKNMYRTELIRKNNIYFESEKEIMYEDYLFNLKAYYFARKIICYNTTQYMHNIVIGSLSRKFRYNYVEMIEELSNRVEMFILREQIDCYKEEFFKRKDRFFCKVLIDAMYNLTFSKDSINTKYLYLKNILQRKKVKDHINKKEKINLPFYYQYLYFCTKHGLKTLLFISLEVFRRLSFMYRVVKAYSKC